MAVDIENIAKQMPTNIGEWKKAEGETYYTPDNLFKYINGGAELYISYDFRKALAVKYEKEGEPEIAVDIFDMGNSYNAFGVFSHSREKVDHTVGNDIESEYAGGLLTFWKGKFYISIMAYPESEIRKKNIVDLSKLIAGYIDEKSEKPDLISSLPSENLIADSIRYFHHYIWLNTHFYIADKNILQIEKDTDAVLARYKEDSKSFYVLMIKYPDHTRSQSAFISFMSAYLPDAKDNIKKLEDGRWSGAKLHEQFITVVLNAPSAEKIKQIFEK